MVANLPETMATICSDTVVAKTALHWGSGIVLRYVSWEVVKAIGLERTFDTLAQQVKYETDIGEFLGNCRLNL